MFNLFRSQEKGKKIMLSVLLGLVSLGMLMYLIPSGPSMGGTAAQSVVAEVAGEKITEDMVFRRLRQTFGQTQLPPSSMAAYVPILIQRMIEEMAVAKQADRMGFRVSEAEVGRQIRTDPNFVNLPPDQEANALQQMGYTVEEFVASYRKNAVENMLNTMAAMTVIVTPQEVEKMFRDANEKIKLQYIDFPVDKFKSGITVAPAELQTAYNRMKASYTIPESRNAQVILIDQDQVAATVKVPEAQLQAYYEAHKDDFRVKDRVKVRRILFDTVGKVPDEVAKIKAKAQDVLKQARAAGADFAALAKKNSQDQATVDKGGDLGWMQREQLSALGPFADVAFKLKPGEVSDLVTTQFGFDIIKVEEKEPSGLQPFDKVRDQIAPKISGQLVIDKMQTLAAQARADLMKAPQSGEQIASKLGLQFVKADDVLPEGVIAGVGASKELGTGIASLAKGQVSEAIQVSPTRLAIATVTQVNPPRVRPFAEVEAQVRESVIGQKSTEAVQQKAKQAADMLVINKGDIEAVAKSFGLEVKTSDPFNRNGSVAATMGASFFGDIFTKPIGATVGPINAGGQTVVAKLIERTEPDMKELAAQRDNILRNLKDKKLEERRMLFQDSVVYQFTKEGKIKYHKDVVDRMMSRYQQS
jgi:peptidyl-prolyl cis-trans isomerase D